MKKIIFRKFLFDCLAFFIISLISTSVIIWVFQAVNYMDIIIDDGRDYLVYLNYSLLNFPKIFSKILPFALYVSTLMESLLFNDVRGFFIFIGLLLNDCLNTAYNYMVGKKDNEACAIVRNMYSTEEFLVLPTTHTEYITFITAFLMASMFFKQVFNYGVFVIFSVLVGMTAYSRVSSGCKDFIDAGYSILLGAFKGIIYYVVVKDFYEPKDVTPEEHWLEKALKKILPKSDADDFV